MKEIGLQPTTTGEPGGKETGQSVTHYILPGGRYAKAYAKLKATGFQLHWESAAPEGKEGKQRKAKRASVALYLNPGNRVREAVSCT
jgi:DNA gyrase inhibitor GyrI